MPDAGADLGKVAGGERLGRLFELELQLGFAAAELFGLVLELGEPGSDTWVVIVEGALLEGDQIPVDGGGSFP